jgi:transcriptional regulator with XRE-family HTH domain
MTTRSARPRGSRLRDLRLGQGLSQADLGRELGMSKNTIGAMERDELNDPQYIRHWRKVADWFGIQLKEIYRLPRQLQHALGDADAAESPRPRDRAQELHAEKRRAMAQGWEQAQGLPSEPNAEDEPPFNEGDSVAIPDEVEGLHRTIPRARERAVYDGIPLEWLPPDLETRRRVIGAISSLGLTLYELEALIFVTAATHSRMAASHYKLRPEDYFGRVAALHRAVDDGNYYGRGYEFVFDSATMSELGNDHQPDRRDYERYEQAINRWRLSHGPTLQAWTADDAGGTVGPWWDPEFREEHETDGSLARELRRYIGPWESTGEPVEPEA